MRKSGYRIEEHSTGEYTITYFGLFSQSIPSQDINIRHDADLEDLRDRIDIILDAKQDKVETDGH